MDYEQMPPEARNDMGAFMEDLRQRVGEKAFMEFIEISRKLAAVNNEYGRDPQQEEPPPGDDDTTAMLEVMNLFYSALSEDPVFRNKAPDARIADADIKAAADRTITRLQAEGKITSAELATVLPSITGKKVKKINFPVDKVNSTIWKLLEQDMHGQLSIAVESGKDKGKKEIDIIYSIDFGGLGDNVRITRMLEAYDKRVYIAIGALWAAGNQIITTGQIYYAMGGTGQPAPNQVEKIENAVSKMSGAKIFIDNTQEASVYKYPKVVYDASLLPMERMTAIVNGQKVESAIHLFREPPLISFARGRKQIMPIERQLLTTPLNWTNQNLLLEDYLLETIAHAKRGKRSKKMLYKTIFAEARITEKKQRQRTPEKVKRILDYYQKCGYITGYKVETDGILLDLQEDKSAAEGGGGTSDKLSPNCR